MAATPNKESFLKEYVSPGSPIAFASPGWIYHYYEKNIPYSRIRRWLKGIDAYSLHKQPKLPKPRNPTYAYFKRYQFQIDLIELGHLSEANDGVKYLLCAIDIFTRFAFVEPLKNKTAPSFMAGFKSIMERAGTFPRRILADKGGEIKNKIFRDYCRQNGILLIHSENLTHAPFVERFNRTLKNIMFKYMTHYETDRYIDVLPLLVQSYNHRRHRMIGMTPAQAEKPGQTGIIRRKQEQRYAKVKRVKPKFSVGQAVRISKFKDHFDRGYTPQFQEEIYKIKSISVKLPIPTYELQTLDEDETLIGNFYANELTPVDVPETFVIEKILKRKKDKKSGKKIVLVKWRGYRNPSWIPEEDVVDRELPVAPTIPPQNDEERV